ncbi:MAG: type II toxin-antitoxin system RelE/ParE family toxin [Methanosarcinaceae archaeon]|nr:type II toxin-antitoxin system RelE/ParE family toxin [Methanosarcinaceae archaeon]MDD4497910.1 type II toxin-antitoxin system RelE/ParE family toxin [Methanosarcinaceae archaeon]
MFEILFEKSAFKFLSNIDAKNRQRISEAIENLAEDPFPHDVKRIYGTNEKLFRIRVGEFRVLYRIDYGEIVIVIVDIDSRKRVYKGI